MKKEQRYTLYVGCFAVSLALFGLLPDKIIWVWTGLVWIPVPVYTQPPPVMQSVISIFGLA